MQMDSKTTPFRFPLDEEDSPTIDARSLAQTMAQARGIAMSLLPQYLAKRHGLVNELRSIETTIAHLQDIVKMSERHLAAPSSIQEEMLEELFDESESDSDRNDPEARHQSVMCRTDVMSFLYKTDGAMRVPEIIEGIKKANGNVWAASTVYGVLNRAKKEGLMENVSGTWRLTQKGVQHSLA